MNNQIVFLDTETTDIGPEDRLMQVAFKLQGRPELACELFKPPVPISIDASAVCHITNKMVADKLPFIGSAAHLALVDLFHNQDAILVAHNAEFDVKMLKREGVHPKNVICTMKVQRHLDTQDKIKSYKLQYLRYYYEFEIDADAHTADDDVLVMEMLFDKLAKEISIEEMLRITREPFLLRKLTFGKYKGMAFKDIPRDYLAWLRRQENIEGDLLFTLNHYLNM